MTALNVRYPPVSKHVVVNVFSDVSHLCKTRQAAIKRDQCRSQVI
jgi:hypothetical protein